MTKQNIWEKFILVCSLSAMFMFLTGTKACQEDYEIGALSSLPTTTPTEDGDETISITGTPTTSPTSEATDDGEDDDDDDDGEDAEPTLTPVVTATTTIGSQSLGADFLTELAQLNDERTEDSSNPNSAGAGKASLGKSQNWLGRAFSGDEEGTKVLDSDNDGFADWYESEVGTDPNDIRSRPKAKEIVGTNLKMRMSASDEDMDGSSNSSELEIGTDPGVNDSDGDGFLDGLEIIAGTDPKDPAKFPADKDRDGVGDNIETERGLNSSSADSDRDGVNDAMELIIGSDPLNPDTDADGILDGKEYEMGSDPTISENGR